MLHTLEGVALFLVCVVIAAFALLAVWAWCTQVGR